MEPVWLAFACGLFIGSCLGFLILGLVSINRDNKLKETIVDNEGRIQELELQRELLKGEIFRLKPNNSAKSYRKIDETICHDIVENLTTRFDMDLKVYVKS